MSRIRLSEKHGVNPSMGVCFWCGEDDGTILLMGRMSDDAEAPRRACVSREPCAKCKEVMGSGISFIECDRADGPTGRWLVLKKEAVIRMIDNAAMLSATLASRKAYMEPFDFEKVFGGVVKKPSERS